MEVEFIQDIPIDPEGSWTNMQLMDWMHPAHGPLPDEFALLEGNGRVYKVALWLTDKHILVALELAKEHSKEPWSPDRRGEILQTFRWTIDAEKETIQCRSFSFPLPDIEGDEQWRTAVIRAVMNESVKICLQTKVGSPWKTG